MDLGQLPAEAIALRPDRRWVKPAVVVAAVLAGLALFWYRTASWPIVATVNSQPITRYEVNKLLYSRLGEQALESIIVDRAIAQELAKKQIRVSAADVDGRIGEIKSQFGGEEAFNEMLKFQNTSQSELRRQIELQIGVEKLAGSTDPATISAYVAGLRQQAKVWFLR